MNNGQKAGLAVAVIGLALVAMREYADYKQQVGITKVIAGAVSAMTDLPALANRAPLKKRAWLAWLVLRGKLPTAKALKNAL